MVQKDNWNWSNNHLFFFETWQFFQGVDIQNRRFSGSEMFQNPSSYL